MNPHDDDLIQGPFPAADRWLAARRRRVLAVLLALALVIRAIALVELHDSPVVDAHQHSQMDMQFFYEWAEEIAAGDLLGREPLHPAHQWHVDVAQAHYMAHPELLPGGNAEDLTQEQRETAIEALWNHWYGGTQFHQEPLYPYTLALLHTITTDVRAMFALQMLAGVLTIGLLFGVTRRAFGDLTGVLAAVFGLGFGPLIHFETTLLRASTISMTGLALVYLAQRLAHRSTLRPGTLIGFGAAIGLATTLKATFLPLGIGLLIGILWPQRRQRTAVARQFALVGAGITVILLPVLVRNIVVGAPIFGLSSVASVTFAGSNFAGYVPRTGWRPFNEPEQLARLMDAGDGHLLRTIQATLASHDGIASYLALLWAKLAQVFVWIELPNNTNVYYTGLHSTVVAVQRYLVAAWWVLPLALVGLAVGWRQRRRVGSLTWLGFACLAPMIAFYMLARFRLPLIVAMMPFAAIGALALLDGIRRRRYLSAGIGIAVVAGLGAVMLRPVPGTATEVSFGNFGNAWIHHYQPRINAANMVEDHAAAAVKLEQFLSHLPPQLRVPGLLIPQNPAQEVAIEFYRAIHEKGVGVFERAGDTERRKFCAGQAARLQESLDVYRRAPSKQGK